MIPCKDCITLASCISYLSTRYEEYDEITAWVSYNCVSLYRLQRKCTLLSSYFPCSFNEAWHPSWCEDCSILPNEWFDRYNEFVRFYRKFWITEEWRPK